MADIDQALVALAERVEKLTGPDREVDCLVVDIVGGPPEGYQRACVHDVTQPYWWSATDSKAPYWVAPRYSASLDAAMSLADPSWWLTLRGPLSEQAYGYSRPEEREFRCHFEMIGAPYSAGARGATLPLAVVAACLKGRARAGGEG